MPEKRDLSTRVQDLIDHFQTIPADCLSLIAKKYVNAEEIAGVELASRGLDNDVDNSPSLKRGDSPTYTPRGFRIWSSCFPVATNVSTPQADTECPSANKKYSRLRYKKQGKFVPYGFVW